jgi:hypothetical protein
VVLKLTLMQIDEDQFFVWMGDYDLGVEANGANDEFEKHLLDLLPFMSYLAKITIG